MKEVRPRRFRSGGAAAGFVQRQDEEEVQERAPATADQSERNRQGPGEPSDRRSPEVPDSIEDRIDSARGGGEPLPPGVQSFFESRFGRGFSRVRIHTDGESASISRALNAQAFTIGQDIFFGAGRFQPDTAEGGNLLAHELTHVVQQGAASALPRQSGHEPAVERQTDQTGAPQVVAPASLSTAGPSTTPAPGAESSRPTVAALSPIPAAGSPSMEQSPDGTSPPIGWVPWMMDRFLDVAIEAIRRWPTPPLIPALVWRIVKAGYIGFLEGVRDQPPDKKYQYAVKILLTLVSPKYYGGFVVGVANGFLVEGLLGLLWMIKDIILAIPDVLSAIYDFLKKLLTDVEAIKEMIALAGEAVEELRKFLGRPDAVEQVIAYIIRSPQIVLHVLEQIAEASKDLPQRAGRAVANAMFKFILENDLYTLGLKVGTVFGHLIFEVLFLVFTFGSGTLIKAGAKILQILAKGLSFLARGLRKGAGMILGAFRWLAGIVRGAARLAERLGDKLKGYFGKVRELIDRIIKWIKRALSSLRKKPGKKPRGPRKRKRKRKHEGKPGDRRRFEAFQLAVEGAAAEYRADGVALTPLRNLVSKARKDTKARRVATRIKFEPEVRLGRLSYKVTAIASFASFPNRRRDVANIERLPTGETEQEAIPIDWFKPVPYPAINLTPLPQERNRWGEGKSPPPAPGRLEMIGSHTLVVPQRQVETLGEHTEIGVANPYLPTEGKTHAPCRPPEAKNGENLQDFFD